MTLVNVETGEVVVPLNRDEAQMLTAKIKGYVSQAWLMLVEAHDRHAHTALGYATWADYVQAEFEIGRSRSYQILDQARVIREIDAVVSTAVDIAPSAIADVVTERDARDVKPNLKAVTDSIREKVTAEATVEPQRVKEIVAEVVAIERDKAKQEAEDRKAIADLNEQAKAAGMDVDPASLAEKGAFSRLCLDIAKQAEPAFFIAKHRSHLTERHIAQAERAHAWLGEFLTLIGEAK